MAIAGFTQSGFEAYQGVISIADLTIGNVLSISATKQLLPNTTSAQDIGSTALRFNNIYTTNLDYSGTLTGGTGAWTIGTTHLTKDANGNFGMGAASSTNYRLLMAGSNATAYTTTSASLFAPVGASSVAVSNSSNTDAGFAGIVLSANNASASSSIAYIGVLSNTASVAGTVVIGRRTNSTAYSESARWDTSGHYLPGATATYNIGAAALMWNTAYVTNYVAGRIGNGLYTDGSDGRLILAGGSSVSDGASVVLRASAYVASPGTLELWSWSTGGSVNRWTIGGSTNTGHFAPTVTNVYDIGTSALKVRAGYFTTFYADTYPDNPSKNYVKWATTTDLAPSTYSAGVLTGYSNGPTVALTSTLGSQTVTTTSTATVRVGASVSLATANIPANSRIYSVASATTFTMYDIPGWTLATTAVTGTGTTATATFAAQTSPPYSVGTKINTSGITPSTYNGSFTVTACTTSSVSWASAETVTATVQGSISNMMTTTITGTGTTATATFTANTFAPFAVGSSITVTGTTPSTYSGTFTVTACTTASVSWASAETVTATVQGYIAANITAGTSVSTTFSQAIAAFTADSGAATAVGDRVLVKDMTTLGGLTTNGQYTGTYTVTTVGSTTVPWVLTRATDSDTIAELAGATYVVLAGTINGGKSFRSYAKSTDTLDTTQIVWNKLVDQLASSRGPLPVTTIGIDLALDTKTVTFTGGNVAAFAANSIGRMTVATTSASTYTTASTLYIAGAPIASTNTTITNAYSLHVAQGESYFQWSGNVGGAIQVVGYSTSYGVAHTTPRLTGAVNVVMGVSAGATWLISGTSNGVFRGGIQLLDAGGTMRLYSNATTGLAVSGSDLQPFATATGNIGTSALRFVSVYANGADIAGNIRTTGATGTIGYGAGSGGTVTQLTSKATGATLNKGSGLITTAADALAAGAVVSFTFTNSTIASTADSVYVHRQSGGTAGAYNIWVDSVAAGSCVIYIKNISAGSLSEAIVLSFKVLSGATA